MITFQSHAGIYTLEVRHLINISLDEAWHFFSSPANLSKITPQQMGFQITSGTPSEMYPGQIITYRVSPFRGITTNWVTEITHVLPGSFFVDEQRFGPYRMWHHEHHFEVQGVGVLMTDRVSYKLPLGILGRIAHFLFVRNQLKHIFAFRREYLITRFGQVTPVD